MSFRNGRFGKLTIRKEVRPNIFYCDCDCGNEIEVWRSVLANNVQRNCGMCCCPPWDPRKPGHRMNNPGLCYAGHKRSYLTRTGKTRTYNSGEFNTWNMMIARCKCKKHPAYSYYGGRGIRVCERWKLPRGQGFKNFLADMGPRGGGMTLDRINPQGHYEPTNCRWATLEVQAKNQCRYRWPKGGPEKMPDVEGFRAMEARIQADFEEMHPF
jgi:hypothetical protein